MQTALTFRTNRDLFSNYYLDEHLPETEAWDAVSDAELETAYDDIVSLWEREKETAPKRNESQLEEKFVRPMFRKLGIPFEVEESTSRTQRRPDYGFFDREDSARDAFTRREEGGDFYENAVAVADAKRWGRPLDTRGSGEHERDFENPSYQIHVYLQETPTQWAVLTNGQKWRLYYGPTSHRLDSYYEIDLPTVLESGDLEEFKYFYLFFRHEAFLEDASGDSFLDDVYDESNVFAQELGEDLQDNIYEAIKVLSEGFLQYPDNDLDEDTLAGDLDLLTDREHFEQARLDLIHDSSLIYLYRLIFVLYAEAEGRELLDTSNEIYEQSYSLNGLKQEVAEEIDSGDPKYRDWQDDLQDRLDELFTLIDKGSKSRGIPKDDLKIPAYNGGLFRTDPDEDESREARFLAEFQVGDAHLARVIDLLARSHNGNGGGKIFVDYSSLDVRHLGSIYEGLLEYQLNVADEPLALDEGEYVPAGDDSDPAVEPGEVYLTTDSGERKATGSYYTPEYVVEYIVENTLGPLVEDIREDLVAQSARGEERSFAEQFAEEIFDLNILDPAMGSGHFLTSAVDYLAREIIDAQEKQAAQEGIETVDEDHDINWARRKVAQRCIYGVDLNPLAVELAKVSLWLRTLAAEQPLAFLDHHLKTGNSLVGSDIENVLQNGESGDGNGDGGQLTLQESFDHTRQRALEHVMERFQTLLSIDNETLSDIKAMEDAFDEVREDPLYQHLLAMANVHTASEFGVDVPADADHQMADALRDDSWEAIEDEDWFRSAQAMADEERFFHWELEFPVAFYDEGGGRKGDAGFDVVIGNPPYVSSRNEDFYEVMGEYVDSSFDLAVYQVDLYLLFTELAVKMTKRSGLWGYIEPDVWIGSVKGENVREWLVNQQAIERIALPKNQVFNVDVDTLLIIGTSSGESNQTIIVTEISESGLDYERRDVSLPKDGSIFPISENAAILEVIEEDSVPLEMIARTGRGIGPYHHSQHSEETIENRAYHSNSKEDETYRPELAGKDIERHLIDWNEDRWISYGDWLAEPREPELFEGERLLCRKILSQRLCCSYVDSNWLVDQQVYVASQFKNGYSAQFATAILASTLMGFYARTKFHEDTELFPHLRVAQFRDLPIHRISFELDEETREDQLDNCLNKIISYIENGSLDAHRPFQEMCQKEHQVIIHDLLVELVESISEKKRQRHSLNLSLLDYLGNYTEGDSLPDLGQFQPEETNILDETANTYEKLRVGRVKTISKDKSVAILATAKYKPENEDEYETDRWGYTETEYLEAFTLTDLTDTEAALVEAFVPAAVEEGDGFANFRENATKTISLLDRLKAMTVPDPDDVEDDLRRYLETKARADELDAKIEKTDRLIDEIVYDLYGLTDEEIEIVEEAIGE